MTRLEIILYKDTEHASGGAIKNSHIATKIVDDKTGEDFYFSWGYNVGKNFNSELNKYKNKATDDCPLIYQVLSIPVNKKFSELKETVERSKYNDKNESYKPYSLLQNNCASCTIDILKFSGLDIIDQYFTSLNSFLFHLPETVFEKATEMAKQNYPDSKEERHRFPFIVY